MSSFDLERVDAVFARISNPGVEVPLIATQLTWLTIDYMEYLRSDPQSQGVWTPAREQREYKAAKQFVQLLDCDDSWSLVQRLAPEFNQLVEEEESREMPELLRRVLDGVTHRISQVPQLVPRHERRQELETRLQASTLQAQVMLLVSALENAEQSDSDKISAILQMAGGLGRGPLAGVHPSDNVPFNPVRPTIPEGESGEDASPRGAENVLSQRRQAQGPLQDVDGGRDRDESEGEDEDDEDIRPLGRRGRS